MHMERYQVTANVVLIGSKASGDEPSITNAKLAQALAQALAGGALRVDARTFSTGSTGFNITGKVEIGQ